MGTSTLKISTQPADLPWPNYGESAVGLLGSGVISTHGQQTPLPIASVAKLITALVVLNKYPLSIGQQGPTITLDTTDYGFYTTYVSEQGSVVPVYSGEQLSEYQMLEAMLVPSGNNIADSLARWAFGSVAGYDSFANTFVNQLGMKNTLVAGDASGFLPATT
ncbi:MAG: D-alanyl-D-alanine carboxypeptidase, partial [Candidatus Saccharimonadales bacterium]